MAVNDRLFLESTFCFTSTPATAGRIDKIYCLKSIRFLGIQLAFSYLQIQLYRLC